MKILVVEDDPKTSSLLKKGLSENGFTVEIAQDGEEGVRLAAANHFDLAIVDIMLPKLDGWQVIAEMRRLKPEILCLVLTARDSVDDKIKGLDLGADVYLPKPFAFSELLAQIRSLLRRGPAKRTDVIRIADLEVDLVNMRALRSGKSLDLTGKEFNLLSLLTRRSGEIISRAVIAEQLWGMNFDSGTNVVEVHIRRLRSKVDDDFEKKLIQTVRGMGYVLREEN